MQNQIKHLKHSEIDTKLWDECIENSPNGLIYAFSWYLDVVAPGWEALVYGNYDIVMPLPVRKKFGVKYVYVPYFTQQLGLIGNYKESDLQEFINTIPKDFKLIDLNLNEDNLFAGQVKSLNSNFKLNLNLSYELIKKAYSRNCTRNIKKAISAEFSIQQSIAPTEFVTFIKSNLSEQLEGVGEDAFLILERLVETALKRKKGELICLKDKSGNMQAAGFYLFDKQRLIFSVCASSDFGKSNQAMYLLVDSQIKKYAGKFGWYDFSGSNIKGIAYFNSTFGAEAYPYQTISINRLPIWLRWLKK